MEYKWKSINSKDDIPHEVIHETIKFANNKSVIDFGSGLYEDQHIDFKAKHVTRWDISGVVCCSQIRSASTIEEIIQSNSDQRFVFVFFRVLSVLPEEDILYVKNMLKLLRSNVDYIVVYDYMWNNNRSSEYSYRKGELGDIAQVEVEWWPDCFYHYTDDQLANIVGGTLVDKRIHDIPAVKHLDDFGTLSIFEC